MRLEAEYHILQDGKLADVLAGVSGLAKARIKDCQAKGGVTVSHQGKPFARQRKASHPLRPGDRVRLAYDAEILAQVPVPPRLVADRGEYSVWDKPAGLLSQGTQFGDHCALLRLAGLAFQPQRPTFLVHRLDREASGLMLIAHSKAAAAALSQLFQGRSVVKEYLITVAGRWDRGQSGTIDLPLDGKAARTSYQLQAIEAETNTSRLLVSLHSGRLHQIRRHFALLGFPVLGDPRYGTGNKTLAGLQLRAVRLSFSLPHGRQEDFRLDVP